MGDEIWGNTPGSDRTADRWNRILPFEDWITREGYRRFGYNTCPNPTSLEVELKSINIPENQHGFVFGVRLTNTGNQTVYYRTEYRKLTTDPWIIYDVLAVKERSTEISPYYFRLNGNVFFRVIVLAQPGNDGTTYGTIDYCQVPSKLIDRGWEYPNNP